MRLTEAQIWLWLLANKVPSPCHRKKSQVHSKPKQEHTIPSNSSVNNISIRTCAACTLPNLPLWRR